MTAELRTGRRVHVIEAGAGPPVVFLHGTNTSSLSFLPILDRIEGVHAIAVDRPGLGHSKRFRDAAVEFVDETLDALGLDTAALAGNSMGGTWGLWYALARPERVPKLILLGSAPLLPGTRPPIPLRVMSAPLVGAVLPRVIRPNRKLVVRLMASMGEQDTIVRYPELIESVVEAASDPATSAANRAELRAVLSLFGFRTSARIDPDTLARLVVPTLLIWGERDPVGGAEVARAAARLIPNAQLELLPAGHIPYLGHPERVCELLTTFVRSR
jgi:pimeloyl-ACP methyl ester carboxylesterase